MNFTWDDEDPLARAKSEKKSASQALQDYWLLFQGLSLTQLHKHYTDSTQPVPTRSLDTLKYWSRHYAWQARIERAKELRRVQANALWVERRNEIRERDYGQAERLRKLTDDILAETPRFLKTTRRFVKGKNGEADKEIITIALDAGIAVRALETSSKLQRMAADMETESTSLNVVVGEKIEDVRRKRWEQIAGQLGEILEDDEIG